MTKLTGLKDKKIDKAFLFASFCILVFFTFMSYIFPYSGDDWAWGSQTGIDRLNTFFDNYNGRYFGNFLILAISRSRILKTIVMGISYYLTCYVCYKYPSEKKTSSLLFSVVIFLFMAPSIFAQAVVWASGYSNYVPSALLSVAYILIVKNITGNEIPKYPKYMFIVTFFIGFAAAPFMENVTLFNIALGVAVIFYTALKFKKAYAAHISFLLGAIIGAVWMFTNSVYLSIFNHNDEYRDVPKTMHETISTCITNCRVICNWTFINNVGLCILISLLLLILTVCYLSKAKDKKIKKAGAITSLVINILFTASAYAISTGKIAPVLTRILGIKYYNYLMIALTGIFFLSIVASILLCVEKGKRFRMLLPLYCVPVSVAPLLVINPIGPRCFFISYLLTMVFMVDLFSYVSSEIKSDSLGEKIISSAFALIFFIQAVSYLCIFVPIYKADTRRNEFAQLQSANGEEEIVIKKLPDASRVWTGTPHNDLFEYRYKAFYGLNEEAELVIVNDKEFNEFYDNYNK